MGKYRIIEATNGLGEKSFTPQYKDFFGWQCWFFIEPFNTYEEAINYIKKQEKTIKIIKL